MNHLLKRSGLPRALGQNLSSLARQHSPFLSRVAGIGDGEVILSDITPASATGKGRVLEILLSNPVKRNAICGRMMNQFAEVVDKIVAESSPTNESDVVAVVLRGAGNGSFSSGADIDLVQKAINTPELGLQMSQLMTEACNRLRNCGLLSLVCIDGLAIGGGAELATVGDFRIITQAGFIQFVHARIGAAPGWGGARRLTEIVGRRHALSLLLSSNKVSAEKALALGLVDALVSSETPKLSDEEWRERSLLFLQPYLAQPYPKSLRAIKAAVAASEFASTADAIATEQEMFKSRWCSKDNNEAIAKAKGKGPKA